MQEAQERLRERRENRFAIGNTLPVRVQDRQCVQDLSNEDKFYFERELTDGANVNIIKVLRGSEGVVIGYVDRRIATEMASRMVAGYQYIAKVREPNGYDGNMILEIVEVILNGGTQ